MTKALAFSAAPAAVLRGTLIANWTTPRSPAPRSPWIAVDPSAAGGGLINQPDHRADAQAHLSRDTTDTDALGPQRQRLLHLLRLALFHRPPAKLFAFSTRTG